MKIDVDSQHIYTIYCDVDSQHIYTIYCSVAKLELAWMLTSLSYHITQLYLGSWRMFIFAFFNRPMSYFNWGIVFAPEP